MKKGILLFTSAIVVGVASAFTTIPNSADTPVYNSNSGGGLPSWQADPNPSQRTCDDDTARPCKGLRSSTGAVTITHWGYEL